ncbi:hypothetical protein ACFQ67_11510 [Streptomyces sp. NPDC056488]|uniref:hypothetical protein n=1 Tax=Streptomyces sp. NPDC056488 TaxID=3345836 RepID=UPI0036D0F19A
MSNIILTVITILGAVLTLGGLAYGARKLSSEYKELGRKLDEVANISQDSSLTSEEKEARRNATLPITSNWDDVTYFREWVRYFILQQAVTGLGWPAALTASGVVLSTVASTWSVWL